MKRLFLTLLCGGIALFAVTEPVEVTAAPTPVPAPVPVTELVEVTGLS